MLNESRKVELYAIGSQPEVEKAICEGRLVVGSLKIIKWGMGIAFVTCPGLGVDIEIHGFPNRGAAFPDDIVAVELEDESTWNAATTISTDEEKHVPFGIATGGTLPDGRAVHHVIENVSTAAKRDHPVSRIYELLGTAPPSVEAGKKPRGKVIAVLERRNVPRQPCRFASDPGRLKPDRFYRFRPFNERYPMIAVYGRDIPTHFYDNIAQVLPYIEIDEDAPFVEKKFPKGKMILSLGFAGTAESETKAIAASNNVKDAPFSEEVLACVMQSFVIPSPQQLAEMGRRDLRKEEFVCTIDPATARDLDDALSVTKVPGGYRVGVHIADVSHFVPIDTELDREARSRSTSTYFVERVIPMLPHKLCEDYCSLNAGEDKFAFSALFHMDNNGVVTSEWFGQSVIRNSCRMAYEDAQRIIDGDESGESLKFHDSELTEVSRESLVVRVVESVKSLFRIAQQLRNKRFDDGALSLNKQKMKFSFDEMNSKVAPRSFELEKTKEANWMVEQFMLLANVRVAEKIVEFMPECAILRKHDAPKPKKLSAFGQAAEKNGFRISTRSSKGLNDSLLRYADDPRSDALRLMATYCMQLAKYISSGIDGEENIRHYALATPCYTHFTSPIRRYCDLVAHRQLLLALDIERQVKKNAARGQTDAPVSINQLPHHRYYLSHQDVSDIADNANTRKEAARKCSEASLKLFFCLFLEARKMRSGADGKEPVAARTQAVVVRIKEESFTLYAAEIATDCEVFTNNANQVWEDISHNDEDGNFTIKWKGDGPRSEVREEKLELFSNVVVELRVCRDSGMMKLEMILMPPSGREISGDFVLSHSL